MQASELRILRSPDAEEGRARAGSGGLEERASQTCSLENLTPFRTRPTRPSTEGRIWARARRTLNFASERAWDQPELQRFLLDITLILIYTAFIRDLFRLRRMTPFHATKHTYNNITKSGLSRQFAAESSIVSPGHITPLTTNDDPADLALVHSHYSYSRSRPAVPFTTHGIWNARINSPSCAIPRPTQHRRIDHDGSRMQSTMLIGWTRGFCCRTAGWGIAWIGLEVTGREMVSWAWRAIGGRHGQECLGGRWVAPMAWPGTDEHQEGKHRWPEPASGPHCLSRLTPTGQRGILVDKLIWRERRTRLSFPPTPCILRQNTHLIFLQAMRGPTAMPETKSQSQGSGKRGPQTTRACHTRMTKLASAVRRVGGQPTTRLPSRRVWADSFFFCTFAMWSVCVSGGEWSPPVWVWLFCAARPPVFFC